MSLEHMQIKDYDVWYLPFQNPLFLCLPNATASVYPNTKKDCQHRVAARHFCHARGSLLGT